VDRALLDWPEFQFWTVMEGKTTLRDGVRLGEFAM